MTPVLMDDIFEQYILCLGKNTNKKILLSLDTTIRLTTMLCRPSIIHIHVIILKLELYTH